MVTCLVELDIDKSAARHNLGALRTGAVVLVTFPSGHHRRHSGNLLEMKNVGGKIRLKFGLYHAPS
jgi:hypothetical protein